MAKIIIDSTKPPIFTSPVQAEIEKVVSHKSNGIIEWDPSKIELYYSEKQKQGKEVSWAELREEVKDMPTLNATILHYLFDNVKDDDLFPKEWIDLAKQDNNRGYLGKGIIFWDTVFEYGGENYKHKKLFVNSMTMYYPMTWRQINSCRVMESDPISPHSPTILYHV